MLESLCCSVAILLGAASPAPGGTLWVDDEAPRGGDGTSWATAYQSLQDALAYAAGSMGRVASIHVAQGVYTPDHDEAGNITPGDRFATFHLVNGVTVLGGYAGFGHADPDVRDIVAYPAVLSGDLLGDDGPAFSNNGENCYHVVTADGTSETAVLDGVIVRSGHADLYQVAWRGAGLLVDHGAATITRCTFEDNTSDYNGGAVFVFVGHASIGDCSFANNKTSDFISANGGAVSVKYGYSPTVLANCEFSGNDAYSGGAVEGDFALLSLVDCTFDNNTAHARGGAVYAYYSGLVAKGCSFVGNTSGEYGGAMKTVSTLHAIECCDFESNESVEGGALSLSSRDPIKVTQCSFTFNAAESGGAVDIHAGAGWTTFRNCLFEGNVATRTYGSGGAIAANYTLDVIDSQFLDNHALVSSGGAIAMTNYDLKLTNSVFFKNSSGLNGGAVDMYGDDAVIRNCTFSDNSAANLGGGISFSGSYQWAIENCVLWSNVDINGLAESSQMYVTGGSLLVSYSCIGGLISYAGNGNIGADPGFMGQASGNLRPAPGSPCIDAGDNAAVIQDVGTDLDGSARFLDDPATPDTGSGTWPIVDIGAYEYLPGCLTISRPTAGP